MLILPDGRLSTLSRGSHPSEADVQTNRPATAESQDDGIAASTASTDFSSTDTLNATEMRSPFPKYG